MRTKNLSLYIAALAVVFVCAACAGRTAKPAAFTAPIDSRLILQVPFHPNDAAPCAASALAAVMTFNGSPTIMDTASAALEAAGNKEKGRAMVIWARHESMKASFFDGTPEQLVETVKAQKPAIVRLDRKAGEIEPGNYAVVVGYSPDGAVLNSCDINQQIVPWGDFLSAWNRAGNLMIMIEPL